MAQVTEGWCVRPATEPRMINKPVHQTTKSVHQLQPGDTIGPYTVLKPISNGGMAWVLRVQLGHNDQLALKISRMRDANDEAVNIALRKEAELLEKLNHKRIVRIFPIHDEERRAEGRRDFHVARAMHIHHKPWYFVMEHLSGGTVQDYVKSLGRTLTTGEATNIAGNVALALHHMHAHGLSHNDVKPDNVLFRTPPRNGQRYDPVLIDFGIAANAAKKPDASSLYITAPERVRQIKDLPPASPTTAPTNPSHADTWAVGILLYFMLTGKIPFSAFIEDQLIHQILNHTPPAPAKLNPEVPAAVSDFVLERCLAKNPAQRASIPEMAHFLTPYGAGDRGLVRSARD